MTKNLCVLAACAVFVSSLASHSAFGWGENGHRITAEIAARNLNEKAKAAVESILGKEHLAEIATWPDDIRSDKSWDFVKPWHFLSIDDDKTFENDYKPTLMGDVMQKLKDFERFLRDPNAKAMQSGGKTIDKRQALAFYVHFVGDIHQPLHVGRVKDRGANKVLVDWFDEEINLHKVWDENLIESTNLSYTEFSTFLNRVSEEEKKEWQSHDYLVWAQESKDLRDKVYDFGKQDEEYYVNIKKAPKLSYDYRSKALPILRERLAKGGIRLAGKLNEIFAGY